MKLRRAFWVFALLTAFTMIGGRIFFVAFPLYLLEMDFSATEIGIIFSVASLILMLSRTFIGRISDMWGRKRIMSLGLLLSSGMFALYPLVSKIYEFIVVKGVNEVGKTLSLSTEDALIADTFEKGIRAKVMARLGTVVPIARAVSMVVGFLVVTYISLSFSFYVTGLFFFIAFLVFTIFYKEDIAKVKPRVRKKIKAYSRHIKILSLAWFFSSLNYTLAYYPGFFILSKNLGVSEGMLFLLLLGSYVVSGFFAYWSGRWIDRVGRMKTAIVSMLGVSVFTVLYAFSHSVLIFFVVMVMVSIFYYIWRIAYRTSLMDITDPEVRGEQIGFARTLQGLGAMVGPAIGGFLIDFVSLQSAFFFAGLAGIISMLLVFYLTKS